MASGIGGGLESPGPSFQASISGLSPLRRCLLVDVSLSYWLQSGQLLANLPLRPAGLAPATARLDGLIVRLGAGSRLIVRLRFYIIPYRVIRGMSIIPAA